MSCDHYCGVAVIARYVGVRRPIRREWNRYLGPPPSDRSDLKDIGVLLGHRRKMLAAAGEAPATPHLRTERKRTTQAERRQLTVMLCDLVGSTAISARLDPEDMGSVIGAYLRCCTELIERHGGFVARLVGDGVVAYFGYPQAHELDAEHAV